MPAWLLQSGARSPSVWESPVWLACSSAVRRFANRVRVRRVGHLEEVGPVVLHAGKALPSLLWQIPRSRRTVGSLNDRSDVSNGLDRAVAVALVHEGASGRRGVGSRRVLHEHRPAPEPERPVSWTVARAAATASRPTPKHDATDKRRPNSRIPGMVDQAAREGRISGGRVGCRCCPASAQGCGGAAPGRIEWGGGIIGPRAIPGRVGIRIGITHRALALRSRRSRGPRRLVAVAGAAEGCWEASCPGPPK